MANFDAIGRGKAYWCTRCAATCEMIVPPDKVAPAVKRAAKEFGFVALPTGHHVGTCLIEPPAQCQYQCDGGGEHNGL